MGQDKIDDLKGKVKSFLLGVTNDNLHESYDPLINILLPYRGELSREDIYDIFISLDEEMHFNNYQEEVTWDISNRLFGACRPGQEIAWWPIKNG
jgi:hypothetical protein